MGPSEKEWIEARVALSQLRGPAGPDIAARQGAVGTQTASTGKQRKGKQVSLLLCESSSADLLMRVGLWVGSAKSKKRGAVLHQQVRPGRPLLLRAIASSHGWGVGGVEGAAPGSRGIETSAAACTGGRGGPDKRKGQQVGWWYKNWEGMGGWRARRYSRAGGWCQR
jgi:hypothetical protein